MHCISENFYSMALNQWSAAIGSFPLVKMGGLVRTNPWYPRCCSGCTPYGWACMVSMTCTMRPNMLFCALWWASSLWSISTHVGTAPCEGGGGGGRGGGWFWRISPCASSRLRTPGVNHPVQDTSPIRYVLDKMRQKGIKIMHSRKIGISTCLKWIIIFHK